MRARPAVAALALLLAAACGDDGGRAPTTGSAPPTSASSPTTAASCAAESHPVLVAGHLPAGWDRRLVPGAGGGSELPSFGHWEGPPGAYIDLVLGPSPYPLAGGGDVVVLGAPARIGPVHEGYAVEFGGGCPKALLGFGVTEEELRRVAEGLQSLPADLVGPLWPHNPAAAPEPYQASAEAVVGAFARQVLGWRDATVEPARSTGFDQGRWEALVRHGESHATATLDQFGDAWFLVGFRAGAEATPLVVRHQGGRVHVETKAWPERTTVAELRIGFGAREARSTDPSPPAAWDVALGYLPDAPGHALALFRDAGGAVVGVVGETFVATW